VPVIQCLHDGREYLGTSIEAWAFLACPANSRASVMRRAAESVARLMLLSTCWSNAVTCKGREEKRREEKRREEKRERAAVSERVSE
jgi:hypothetical protein